jgi:glycosyltransferase involved in cell wall biosynthesis
VLSVVTPSRNASRWIGRTLESVAALPIAHEHVVVDGGSTDGTVDVLRAWDDPALRWISEPDRGQSHAVNKALAMARGDLLMWVNADDEVVADSVARAVAHLERNPETDVVFGSLHVIDELGTVRREVRPRRWSFRRYLFLGDNAPSPTFVFRRSRWLAVGPLDERYEDAADYDFYLRLTHRACVSRMPSTHVRFRYHPASKTAQNVWIQRDEALAIRTQWARGRRDQAMMIGLERLRRRVAPVLTRGRSPAPFRD